MNSIIIYDGKCYWCARRRLNGRIIDMWSTLKVDAGRFHFPEAAQQIAKAIPQQTTFVIVKQ